ncbi:MAG: CAMP factor family pore-forming toxin [Bacillota bacterium]|nr:CAMP factor family pore-forming toxin [Bacillota bacterium]
MKKSNLFVLLLALVLFASPLTAFANQATYEDSFNQVMDQVDLLENSQLNSSYARMTKNLEKSLMKLESSAEAADLKASGARFSLETIYDLDSISIRIELLSEVAKTITVATTELTTKVRSAHTELGFAITRAIFVAADPFRAVEDIRAEFFTLQQAIQVAKSMPDVQDDDLATIYVKRDLDKAIWATRFERDRKILGKVTFEVYKELNANITKAVGVQLDSRSTVREVKEAIVNLQAALDQALAQVK